MNQITDQSLASSGNIRYHVNNSSIFTPTAPLYQSQYGDNNCAINYSQVSGYYIDHFTSNKTLEELLTSDWTDNNTENLSKVKALIDVLQCDDDRKALLLDIIYKNKNIALETKEIIIGKLKGTDNIQLTNNEVILKKILDCTVVWSSKLVDLIIILIQGGCNPNTLSSKGENIFHIIAREKEIIFRRLHNDYFKNTVMQLKKLNVNMNLKDYNGVTMIDIILACKEISNMDNLLIEEIIGKKPIESPKIEPTKTTEQKPQYLPASNAHPYDNAVNFCALAFLSLTLLIFSRR